MNNKTIGIIGLLVLVLFITLGIHIFYNINYDLSFKETMINLDDRYSTFQPIPVNDNGEYILPSGYYYADISNNMMAEIPPKYIITPDKTGIITKDSNDLIVTKRDRVGNYLIPDGYYKVDKKNIAIIPNGFKMNDSKTGITVNTTTFTKPPAITSPTSIPQSNTQSNTQTNTKSITETNDASFNEIIKYNSNNYDIKYHEDISMNSNLKELAIKPVYYEPGAFKYGSSTYVPNYEDSVYLSKTTYQSYMPPIEFEDKPRNICLEYQYFPSRLENACNNMNIDDCKKSSCCVLIGGEKCVSGNENGPTFKYNYSDYTLVNRDFYYYNSKCYGNCPYYS